MFLQLFNQGDIKKKYSTSYSYTPIQNSLNLQLSIFTSKQFHETIVSIISFFCHSSHFTKVVLASSIPRTHRRHLSGYLQSSTSVASANCVCKSADLSTSLHLLYNSDNLFSLVQTKDVEYYIYHPPVTQLRLSVRSRCQVMEVWTGMKTTQIF